MRISASRTHLRRARAFFSFFFGPAALTNYVQRVWRISNWWRSPPQSNRPTNPDGTHVRPKLLIVYSDTGAYFLVGLFWLFVGLFWLLLGLFFCGPKPFMCTFTPVRMGGRKKVSNVCALVCLLYICGRHIMPFENFSGGGHSGVNISQHKKNIFKQNKKKCPGTMASTASISAA